MNCAYKKSTWSLLLLGLVSCGYADPDCGSPDVPKEIIQLVAQKPNNPLMTYALSHSREVSQVVESGEYGKAMIEHDARKKEIHEEWEKTTAAITAIEKAQYDQMKSEIEAKQKGGDLVSDNEYRDMQKLRNERIKTDTEPLHRKLDKLRDEYRDNDIGYFDLQTNAFKEKNAIWESAKQFAVYTIDTIRMDSRNSVTHAVACSGKLHIRLKDIEAETFEDLRFKVEKTTDGKTYVSITDPRF